MVSIFLLHDLLQSQNNLFPQIRILVIQQVEQELVVFLLEGLGEEEGSHGFLA